MGHFVADTKQEVSEINLELAAINQIHVAQQNVNYTQIKSLLKP